MKVAVTGSSGLVGAGLVRAFETAGHQVQRIVRRPARAANEVRWDPTSAAIAAATLEGTDAVVHLAGESLADGRWTAAKKDRLRASRVGPTSFLARTLAGLGRKPGLLVSASAVGYYGNRGDEWLDETSPPGQDFLARLCVEWEEATAAAAAAGIRVVSLRTGIVLSTRGGALARMLPLFRMGLGGALGSGRQHMSWITIDDLLAAIALLVTEAGPSGPMNAVAPSPVTNAVFTKTLGRVLGRPTIVRAPAIALRLAFGEMADAALLASQRVRPERLLASGFRFRHPSLEEALRYLLQRPAAVRLGAAPPLR